MARKRPPSKRVQCDAELVVEIRRIFADNLFVYGADKVWAQLNREGIRVARCTVDDVEFATMTYVDWFNHRRLHGEITADASYTTPAETEDAYYRQTTPATEAITH